MPTSRPLTVWIAGRSVFLSLCVAVGLVLPLAAQEFDGIVKPPPGRWVVDRTGQLDDAAIEAMNRLGNEISEKYTGEIFVVVTDTTRGRQHRRYATDLFNTWGIGSDWSNNGILVFAALDDRASELVLGTGVDVDLDVNHAEVITDQFMIPKFREGDFGAGLYEGMRASAARIFGMAELRSPVDLPPLRERTGGQANGRGMGNAAGGGRPPTNALNPDAGRRPMRARRPAGSWWPWLAGGGLLGVVALLFGWRYYSRYRTRFCHECGNEMIRLTEAEDDQFLEEPEVIEERLGSVDYDVWACYRCEAVDKFRYGTFFTKYSRCPKCRFVTKVRLTETLVIATQQHGGKVRVREYCEHCDYRHQYTYATPRKPKPSSSSSSGSWSGSGGGGWSSGGGGWSGGGGGWSGGGGGFRTGGISAGRGASGRW